MSADKLVFDLSQEVDGTPNVFINKSWLNILDNQNGQYSSNQSVIDTSQLTNSNKYMSYREAYLAIPMLLSLSPTAANSNFLPATSGATSADFALGLKNWFGQIVHSLTLDYNGVTVIQQTPFCNMWNSFKLVTSFSWSDVTTQGASIGFYPDDPLSFTFAISISPNGIGTCNNSDFSNVVLQTTVTGYSNYKSGLGNVGFLSRQRYINYDPDGIAGVAGSGQDTYSTLLTSSAAQTLWKSYVSRKINGSATVTGGLQISIQAIVYLKHLHSFFNFIPLVKGAFMKMTLNLNNTTIAFTSGGGAGSTLQLDSVANAVGGVCPIMVASKVANNGGATSLVAGQYRANLSVGRFCLDSTINSGSLANSNGAFGNSIQLYIPSYSFNPVFESAYISAPIKEIKYTDIYQYQISNVPASSGQINNLVSNGIAGLKSVLVIPFFSAATNLILGAGTGALPAYQSPYDPAGTGCTSPLAHITNFNVVISGQNMIYNTQRYTFEQFANQLYGANAVNGGQTDGLTSGLIDQLGFEMEYCYYYVDVSRMLPIEESVPKSVQIIGQNTSARAMDYFVFCEYSCSMSLDIISGSRV